MLLFIFWGDFPNTAHQGNMDHLAISAHGDRGEISDTWETHSLILGILRKDWGHKHIFRGSAPKMDFKSYKMK